MKTSPNLFVPSFVNYELPTEVDPIDLAPVPEVAPAVAADIAAHPLMWQIPEQDREETAAHVEHLYGVAKAYVAPVVTGFANYLLADAGERQILFAGRDGIGSYIAASILKQSFDYGNDDPDQLVYAQMSRNALWRTTETDMRGYLMQEGVRDPKAPMLLADIGMFGSFQQKVRGMLPGAEMRYLISKNHTIPGYASDSVRTMDSMQHIMGNPAVHFLEDTFSGATKPISRIVMERGRYVPETVGFSYPPDEALVREFALRALTDYASGLTEQPALRDQAAINELDRFLQAPGNYMDLLVPHD